MSRVLNDPKGLLGAEVDQIPVSTVFDVILRTAFVFVGNATQQVDPAAQMRVRLTWPPTPFL